MKKLLEISIGEGTIESGLWPLEASDLVRLLLAALVEEGADPAAMERANPHIQIIKKNSTLAAVHTNSAKEFKRPLRTFKRHLKSRRLGPRGRAFADKATALANPWGYVDLPSERQRPNAKVLRLDQRYRESLDADEKAAAIRGTDELYAKIIRVGGENPPTAKLVLLNGESATYKLKTQDLAMELGSRLYQTVKLTADVTWDSRTLDVQELTVTGIVGAWRDMTLSALLKEHKGILPIEFVYDSVEALIEGRRESGEDK